MGEVFFLLTRPLMGDPIFSQFFILCMDNQQTPQLAQFAFY